MIPSLLTALTIACWTWCVFFAAILGHHIYAAKRAQSASRRAEARRVAEVERGVAVAVVVRR